ncbi:MAG: hypothetical protein HKL88_04190 [Bacteroidia bacterium]|nr:hypothetical protein [Bacteroidia bacterium]
MFSDGGKLYRKNNYLGALRLFLQAYKTDSLNANLQYNIGLGYNKLAKSDSSVAYLTKAVKGVSKTYDPKSTDERSAPGNAYYLLGEGLQDTWNFSQAVKAYKAYKPYIAAGDKAGMAELNHRINQCKTANMFLMAPSNAQIINMGDSINSGYDDYNPVLQPDGAAMLFTSRRPAGAKGENNPNIYISYMKPDSSWKTAHICSKTLNAFTGNTSLDLSADGQTLLVLCNTGKHNAIYQSQQGESDWGTPVQAGTDINLTGNQSDACLSPDGATLFFVSDRPGGMGGKDIWRCVKLPNGNWSKALNMGETINSPYDEESPFLHNDGKTFFFSSQGHNSMGGYDIFFSQADDSGKYSEPFNLGYPINTPANELHFSLSADGKKGFMCSDRPGGKGGLDIYSVVMPHVSDIPLTIIRGQVPPPEGGTLSDDVHIVATDNATNEEAGDFKPIKTTGRFTIIVQPGRSYTLSYQDGDKEFYHEVINVPADAGYGRIHKELNLSPHSETGVGKN